MGYYSNSLGFIGEAYDSYDRNLYGRITERSYGYSAHLGATSWASADSGVGLHRRSHHHHRNNEDYSNNGYDDRDSRSDDTRSYRSSRTGDNDDGSCASASFQRGCGRRNSYSDCGSSSSSGSSSRSSSCSGGPSLSSLSDLGSRSSSSNSSDNSSSLSSSSSSSGSSSGSGSGSSSSSSSSSLSSYSGSESNCDTSSYASSCAPCKPRRPTFRRRSCSSSSSSSSSSHSSDYSSSSSSSSSGSLYDSPRQPKLISSRQKYDRREGSAKRRFLRSLPMDIDSDALSGIDGLSSSFFDSSAEPDAPRIDKEYRRERDPRGPRGLDDSVRIKDLARFADYEDDGFL